VKLSAVRTTGVLRSLTTPVYQALTVLALLVLWQATSGTVLPEYAVSSPIAVGERLVQVLGTDEMWTNIRVTVVELVLGYSLGCLAGTVVGIVFGVYRRLGEVLEPLVGLINAIPKIALAPLLVIFLGLGTEPKVMMAAVIVFFVLFYNVMYGVRATPVGLVNSLKVVGASRLSIITQVILPSMARPLFAGLKAGLPFAMVGVIVGEFIAASEGVGYYINAQSQSYDSAGTIAGICLILLMVLVGGWIIGRAERWFLRWDRAAHSSGLARKGKGTKSARNDLEKHSRSPEAVP
jgi:NitT/TauT family transport system permease protein